MKVIPFLPTEKSNEMHFPRVWAFSADYNQLLVLYGLENLSYAFDDLVYSIYSSLKYSFDLNVVDPKFIIWAQADSYKEKASNTLGEKREHNFYISFYEYYDSQLRAIKRVIDETVGWNSVGTVSKLPPFVFPMYEYAKGEPSVIMARMDNEDFQISPVLVFNPYGISLEFYRQPSPIKKNGEVVLETSKGNVLRCSVRFVQDIIPNIGFIKLSEGVFQIKNFEMIHVVPKLDHKIHLKTTNDEQKSNDFQVDIETKISAKLSQIEPDGLKWYEIADLLDEKERNSVANPEYLTNNNRSKSVGENPDQEHLFTVTIYEMAHLYDGEEYVDYVLGFTTVEDAIEYARRYVRAQVENVRKNSSKEYIRHGMNRYGEKTVVTGYYDSWNELDFFIDNPATPEECNYDALIAKN